MDINYIIDIINKLNCEIYEETQDESIYLDYSTNGFADLIDFCGIQIWSSEDDPRDYINENSEIKENLEDYLRKAIHQKIQILNMIDLL